MLSPGSFDPANPVGRIVLGFLAAAVVALAAFRLKALSHSGALAAVGVGAIAVATGWQFSVLLISFFVAATAVSRFGDRAKAERISAIADKGGQRDALQVLANGGVFALACLVHLLLPGPGPAVAAVGALAAASADTWATEVGTLISPQPRSILSWKRVPPGTSGAVSAPGTLAMIWGAMLIGAVASVSGFGPGIFWAAVVAGCGGALVDSFLGAGLQSRRWCVRCGAFTERPVHSCGRSTQQISGVRWLNNDVVNFFCTLFGAVLGTLWVL